MNFDEIDHFRRKKKILKERFKVNPVEAGCKTPVLPKNKSNLNSPSTEKTTSLMVYSDTT